MAHPEAIIAGAGVAGLAAAHWLTKAGWSVKVVEKASTFRFGGHLMGLSGPGFKALEHMGILDQLKPHARVASENICFDRSNREILRIRHSDLIGDTPFLVIRRSDLVESLAEVLGDRAEITFETSITSISSTDRKARVTLSDGGEIEADLLIGADGMRSQARQLMFPEVTAPVEHLGYRFVVFEVEFDAAPTRQLWSYVAPGHMAEIFGVTEKRALILLVWNTEETGKVSSAEVPDLLREEFDCVHPIINDLITRAEDQNELFVFDTLSMTVLPQWSRGRTVLLGDAAHALSLVSGQGAGMALTGAKILADALETVEMEEALRAYEERMRPAISSLQNRSRKLAKWYVPQSPWAFRRRNLMLKVIPKWLM
ncbi:MAG: FAD-dependent monooxygenase, partial [Pseudomonadota bacterium]